MKFWLYRYVTSVMPIGAMFAMTLWLGNTAYMYISVAFAQMLKAIMPVAVFVLGVAAGLEVMSCRMLLIMSVISFGVLVASYGELNISWIGVVYQMGGVVGEALRLIFMEIFVKRKGLKLNPISVMFYVSPCSALCLFVPWIFLEKTKMEADVSWNFPVVVLTLNSLCTFALNLSVFLVITHTSALTIRVAGVVKDWVMSWQPSLLSQKRKTGPPLGLKNLGNSCYLNSVLQCLTYTPPFANFCLQNQHSSLCDSNDKERKRECPFCMLERRIVRSLSMDLSLDAPAKIRSCLNIFAEHFRHGRQEDAHEFLRYVIDACHNTCLRLKKLRRNITGNGLSNGNGHANGNGHSNGVTAALSSTVVMEIFGGALQSQVKCLSCGTESNKVDEMMDISLDVLHSNSLKDALQRFFQSELLDGQNKYKCESLKKEALSVLRSCGWVDDVTSFMLSRKKLCVDQVGLAQNGDEAK
ncbi:hypothetical protein ACLB2K_028735 [Fragaria x ananassa]